MASRDAEPDPASTDEIEAGLPPVEAGHGPVSSARLGQESARRIVERDQLVLVERGGVDAVFEVLDVLLVDVVERAGVRLLVAAPVAHDPAPAPAGTPGARGVPAVCGPAPSPVAMLNAPVPWNRGLWPSRMTSGRV